jgi:class 3 adenylate cyclase
MNCEACGHSNEELARFCMECGGALELVCDGCGASIPPKARFCSQCGQAQGTSATKNPSRAESSHLPDATVVEADADSDVEIPPAAGERRQLTVMFCDLVGSTALAQRLDPEDYRDVVNAYQDVCASAVKRFDGHIAQFLGDGVLVYFGFPRAHEDDAERAVRAALAIQTALTERNTRGPSADRVAVSARIGIHTGPVVVGGPGRDGGQQALALGGTINIAARLEATAEADGIVISQTTLRLVPGLFITRSLGTPELKGVNESIHVHAVDRVAAIGSRLGYTGHVSNLAGREPALDASPVIPSGLSFGYGSAELKSPVKIPIPIDTPCVNLISAIRESIPLYRFPSPPRLPNSMLSSTPFPAPTPTTYGEKRLPAAYTRSMRDSKTLLGV